MALVLRHGAADFHHGQTLTPASIAAQSVDDHHVFPRGYLNPSDAPQTYPVQLVDCILNRTLIDSNTNQRIGKRAPSKYLDEVRTELDKLGDTGAFNRLLESHLLPSGEGSPLLADDFESFIHGRQEAIASEISAVTLVTVREVPLEPLAPVNPE